MDFVEEQTMRRTVHIISIMTLIAALFFCGDGGSDPAPVNAKYIDPVDGTPEGDGSQTSPYKSFSQVTFEAGTSYLIKRGTVLYEQITVDVSGTASAPIVIGAYGTGADPVIDGSELIDDFGWTDEGGSVYSCILPPTEFVGRGNVKINGAIQKFVTTATPGSGEYTIDSSGKVQIYGEPSVSEVRLSRRYFGIKGSGVSYITIKDLHIRQESLHGIHFENSSNIIMQNCNIEMCGGAFIGSLQAGNGVEFGNSSSCCTVTGCTVSQIFDSGVTCQTYDNNKTASGFTFSSNTISECGFAGVEIAVLSNGGKTGSSISDVSVTGNAITDCGSGFSGIRYYVDAEHPGEGRGIKIMADDGAGTLSGVVVEQCTVESCEAGVFASGNTGEITIKRCRFVSNGYGVVAYDIQTASSLKLAVQSSLFLTNSIGFGFHVTNGNGFELYNNTFVNSVSCSIGVSAHSGMAGIKNNVLYSTAIIQQLNSVTLSSPSIDNNCYYIEGAGFIVYNSTLYNSLSSFNTAYSDFDGNSHVADPSFDVQYKPGSSFCRDGGTAISGVTSDYYGATFRNPPAIGAVEY